MSSLPSFFNPGKPRRFHYTPLYYDPEKEALQQRIAQIEQEFGLHEGEAYVPKIRKGQMSAYFKRKSQRREKASNLRLLVILAILFLLSYILLYS